MTELSNKASRWFRIGVWFFAAATFADAANLDDLLTSSEILHSDEEATAGSVMCQVDPPTVANHGSGPIDLSSHRPAPLSRDGRVVILDQDSPSLAAETLVSDDPFFLAPRHESVPFHSPKVTELLYLKFHVLLI